MEEIKTAVDSTPVAATETVATSTTTETEDMEARFKKLEEEKNNYKNAFLKEKSKNKAPENLDENEDEKISRKVQEALADSRLAEIAREQDAIITKALKENKELKLAQLNKTTAPSSIGAHSESQQVRDTLVTPEQMAQFKKMGWGEKEIARYKQNLAKNTR